MSTESNPRSGAEALVDALRLNSVERIFCIPGESYLAALDALYDRPEIELVICRNEGGAAFMSEADAKLSGRPGVCFVTRGPGATNASGGLHVAMQDSTPMILLIGQIARKDLDREAFQEIDYRRMFGQVAKWIAQIDDADRIPEYVNRAFSVATGGRPGPVVLALPEDMLCDMTSAGDTRPWQPVKTAPSVSDIERCRSMLSAAESPMIIVGGGGWSEALRQPLQDFAAAGAIPLVNSFRCQDYVDNEHEAYAGDLGLSVNPALTQRIRESDCLLVIGARLGEMTTGGFSLIDIPCPTQDLIHVYPQAEELGHIYQPELAINADAASFIAALTAAPYPDTPNESRRAAFTAARKIYNEWNAPVACAGDMQLAEVFTRLRALTDDDAIVCNGAGLNTSWLHRFYRYRGYRTQLAPTSGTMGYGLPAAVAAKMRYPERCVIAVAGDGDFLMTGQELATAMQYRANIIVLVVNNGIYGTIRMHQEREYPERVIGTDMVNPDFVALAEAHGAYGERITRAEQLDDAFARAVAADRPALIEIPIDSDLLTPSATVASLRASKN